MPRNRNHGAPRRIWKPSAAAVHSVAYQMPARTIPKTIRIWPIRTLVGVKPKLLRSECQSSASWRGGRGFRRYQVRSKSIFATTLLSMESMEVWSSSRAPRRAPFASWLLITPDYIHYLIRVTQCPPTHPKQRYCHDRETWPPCVSPRISHVHLRHGPFSRESVGPMQPCRLADPVTALGPYAKGQHRFTGYFDTLRALVAAAVFAALRWRC